MPRLIISLISTKKPNVFLLKGFKNVRRELSTSLMGTCIMVTFMYGMCYLGSVSTLKSSETGQIAFNSNWYQISPDLQIYIMHIVKHTQGIINFNGFRVISCSLETFMRVGFVLIILNLCFMNIDFISMCDLFSS